MNKLHLCLLPMDIIKNILTYDKRITIKNNKIVFNNQINLEDEKYARLKGLYNFLNKKQKTKPYPYDYSRYLEYVVCIKRPIGS